MPTISKLTLLEFYINPIITKNKNVNFSNKNVKLIFFENLELLLGFPEVRNLDLPSIDRYKFWPYNESRDLEITPQPCCLL